VLATGQVSVPDLYRVAASTATSLEQVRSEEWRSRSACFRYLKESDTRPKTAGQQRDFELVADYFLCELPALSDKTRSVILSTFTSMADVLNRGILRDLFTQGCNIDPTATEQGKIIVVNMPLKEYGQVGLYATALWKFAFEKSIERRDVTKSPRPVVLWQDEGQFFLLPSTDFLFTSTSRSARVANVLLTQSISGVVATLAGGPAGKAEADAYLSNYGTKIFHANTDPTSNEYAANLIGRCKQFVISANNNYGGSDGWSNGGWRQQSGRSSGISEIVEYEVQPREFSRLRTGGADNRGEVDAIVFKNGAGFKATGRNWMKVTFKQDFRR
jgi:TraM recognition site of TraD and TraG